MIITVSLDPVMHVKYQAERVLPGTHHQVGQVAYRPGGRGLAVARMLHTFGHEVAAAGLAGGTAGELIRGELARAGVPVQFTRIARESRRVVEVADQAAGTTTSFAEPSPYITTEELGRLAADYRALLDGASAAVLCGGLPAGLPAETYATFATYAAEAGVPVVLDAAAPVLRPAAPPRPPQRKPPPPPPRRLAPPCSSPSRPPPRRLASRRPAPSRPAPSCLVRSPPRSLKRAPPPWPPCAPVPSPC
jgi:tagatose 6-phosphate kinase